MKKYLVVLLVSLIMFSFNACVKEKNEQVLNKTETDVAETEGKDLSESSGNCLERSYHPTMQLERMQPIISITSAGKTVHPHPEVIYRTEWDGKEFLPVDKADANGQKEEWSDDVALPLLYYSPKDFYIGFLETGEVREILVFDKKKNIIEDIQNTDDLANLGDGRYFIEIDVATNGNYIVELDKFEQIVWKNVFELFVGNPVDFEQVVAELEKIDDSVIDSLIYDIDGDGILEKCILSFDPSLELSTYVLSVSLDGFVKYSNTFFSEQSEMSLVTKDGELWIATAKSCNPEERQVEYNKVYIKGNQIVIDGK